MDLCLICIIIVLVGGVNCKRCTRTVSEVRIFTLTEFSHCQNSYREKCHFLSLEECTFYELVPCDIEKNHTVTLYKTIEECCPGYWPDPNSNSTCIRKSDIRKSDNDFVTTEVTPNTTVVPFVSVSSLEVSVNQTSKTVHHRRKERHNYTVQYYKPEDDLLFGLSQGTYAGIICACLFVFCVIALISVHLIKRSFKKSPVKASAGVELEVIEKMIPASQT